MSDVIEFRKEGAVGVITINNPPANALSFAVVKGLAEHTTACMNDETCDAVVVTGAGKMFVAGADIREFNMTRPDDVPEFHDLMKVIEEGSKPIVAAGNGIAVGGGLGPGLGCHYRIIAPGALVGQPEVKLGIIPGAGGTQRLPRLAGVETALDMIVGGDPVRAEKAVELGIADELAGEDLLAHAVAYALEKVADGPRPTGGITSRLGAVDPKYFEALRQYGLLQQHLQNPDLDQLEKLGF